MVLTFRKDEGVKIVRMVGMKYPLDKNEIVNIIWED